VALCKKALLKLHIPHTVIPSYILRHTEVRGKFRFLL